jgi:flagellar biogenesis protein FliO
MFPFNFKQRAPSRQEVSGLQGLGALIQRFLPGLGRRGNLAGTLEHLGTMPLTAQSSLALVKLHDETLLLGITPQSITLLAKGNQSTAHTITPTNQPQGQKGAVEP